MVQPPDIEELIKNTQRVEEIEKSGKRLLREFELLSELSQSRVQETSTIPGFLEKGNIKVAGIKKYDSATEQVRQMIDERFSALQNHPQATYFVEAQDHLLTNQTFKSDDAELFKFNQELLQVDSSEKLRIGLIYLGRQAPGANNVVDGLLRFQAQRKNVELIGFINGVEGLYKEDFVEMTKESFSLYVNLGGIDYIGRGTDQLRTDQEKKRAAEVCQKLGLSGIVMVGATHTLTDGVYLANYFLEQKVSTKVIVIPCTVDGNIHHKYIQTSIGFDTASKVYSQLVGNMLTDSASAVKYWYFIRVMGKESSHLALECALKTSPNMVIVSEECSDRRETISDIVNHICDVITERSNLGNNYGCVLIPEGLLSHLSAFDQLINEINKQFEGVSDAADFLKLQQQLSSEDMKSLLTPWSCSLF